ncbi:IS110 family transposase [Sinorhizobium meliloti]|nr:IS110 family transposase [Sinorhizobium meliloti]RVH27067.1 IS110 family transposase [Sinorhizobium meliloti]
MTTIPGIGAICATAMEALAPSAAAFSKGRDFAACFGLTPKQNSSGGKEHPGRTSKMGSEICGGCSSLEPRPSSVGRGDAARRLVPGWQE